MEENRDHLVLHVLEWASDF